jgi:hypothetical protein
MLEFGTKSLRFWAFWSSRPAEFVKIEISQLRDLTSDQSQPVGQRMSRKKFGSR